MINFIQRLVARWWSLWAAMVGLDITQLTALPKPVVDPQLTAAALIAEAEAQGVADARAATVDQWSFGRPDQAISVDFDPDYVRSLRRRRDAATEALRAAEEQTEARVANIRQMRDEQAERMNGARTRMAGLAVRDRTLEALRVEDAAADGPAPDPEDADEATPWEGESNPLGLVWRLLIIAGLIAAELPVQFYVFDYFIGAGDRDLGRWMAVVTAAVVVFAPFVSAVLLRNRQASTAERRTLHAFVVLAVGWLFVVAVLGFVRGRVLDAEERAAAGLHITAVTVILLFVALLITVGAMAFMLGLARRHPFQEAYVRHRNRRDRFDTLMRTTATQLNPAYREQAGAAGPGEPAAVGHAEQAIREAYAAAEEAYFAALTRAIGDPTFTEAVQQRRGLRGAV